MRTIKYFLAIGLIGMQVGCASNIVVKMPQTTDKAQTELLADVKVMDLRQPGVAASKREAAFGAPMRTIEFDPPAAQLIKQELETELTKLLTEKGIRSKRYYVADLMEFGVNTDTTPLYWDVICRIHLLVKDGENQHDLFGTHTIRTYVWPGEEIIQKVITESVKQIVSGLKPVSAGGMDKPCADRSAGTISSANAGEFAELVVLNVSGATLISGNQDITDNGLLIVSLPRQTYKSLHIAPGLHEFRFKLFPDGSRVAKLSAEKNQTYYLLVGYSPSRSWAFPFAGDPMAIKIITEDEARNLMKGMKQE